jgi:hypothetical protein
LNREHALRLVGVLCLLLLAPIVLGDDEDATRTVWIFSDGTSEFAVDVTDMPPEARAAVTRRLAAQGFERIEHEDAQGRGEDVGADIQDLVRHGGIFPEGTPRSPFPSPPGADPRARQRGLGRLLLRYLEVKDDPERGPVYERVLRALGEGLARGLSPGESLEGVLPGSPGRPGERARGADAAVYAEILGLLLADAPTPPRPPPGTGAPPTLRTPGGPEIAMTFLGASVAPGFGPEGPALRLSAVPEGSLAAEAGLEAGDLLLEIDGRRMGPRILAGLPGYGRAGSKLALRLLRRNGQMETWELEFAPEAGAPAPGGTR